MIDVEQWAEIRRLHFSEGMAIKAIVRSTGLARNTVREAIRSARPPKYERPAAGSGVDPFEPEIRRLLRATPDMPATVIAERIGWTAGMTVLRSRVRQLRPLFAREPEAFGRTEYRPGELAQWDLWFPDVKIPLGFGQSAIMPVIVGVACYSRWILARMIASKDKHDVLGGHAWCLQDLGRVPRKGVYDGEPAISVRRGRQLIYTREYLAFRGTLGMGSIVLAKGHPERKGVVERANGYLETSFLPGRTFGSVDDFNTQLGLWLADRANIRVHAGLRCRPSQRIDADLEAMLPMPVVPPDVDWTNTVRLGADHWVRVDTNDYSVHPRAIGRKVTVRRDADEVIITCGHDVVARHDRVLARHQTITDPTHEEARRARAELARGPQPGQGEDVAQRDLADYDRALGVAS